MSVETAAHSTSAAWSGKCPPWCEDTHETEDPRDVFHRSALAWLAPNAERSGHPGRWELRAYITAPEVPEDDLDVPLLAIETEQGATGPYVELDVEQVEEFIRQGKAFLAHVQQLGAQMAAGKEEQS